ncbi:hypothetical protein GS982_21320 [Rhodococcus hoagii]|nr:hypothetical protein [Prescottella equi]
MSEHDEIGHANREISQLLRMGLQIASRFAEQMARAREQQIRNAQAQSEQAARELRTSPVRERSAAEAGLRPVMTEKWWNEAGPEQIADNWQTARAWQDHSQVAAQAADRIRQEVQSRYGIDVDNPGVDPRQVDQLLRDAEASKNAGNNEQDLADRDRRMASDLMAEAERLDRDRDLLGTDTDDNSTPSDDLRNRQKSSTTQPTAATPSPPTCETPAWTRKQPVRGCAQISTRASTHAAPCRTGHATRPKPARASPARASPSSSNTLAGDADMSAAPHFKGRPTCVFSYPANGGTPKNNPRMPATSGRAFTGRFSLMESNHERASSTSPPFFSSASKSRAMSSLATPALPSAECNCESLPWVTVTFCSTFELPKTLCDPLNVAPERSQCWLMMATTF